MRSAGIDVQCDDAIDPASIARPTCFLTADFPFDAGNQGVASAYSRLILGGNVTAQGSTISWRPIPGTQDLLTQLVALNQAERGILAHLNLRGNFIWSAKDPSSFLDGDGFGTHTGGLNAISLTLPSGDRRRGGDFDVWFWIVAAPSVATVLTVLPAQVFVGDTATVTVGLSAAAPGGSNAIQVASSNPQVAPVPAAAIPVPPGATLVTFQVTAAAVGQTNITATFPAVGGQTVAATLVVQAVPVLTGQLALNPAAIFIGASSVGTVTLSGPAPRGGLVVTLASSNVGVATVAATVTVASGDSSATFSVAGKAAGTATVTATLAGVTLSALITVRAKPKEIIKDRVKEIKEKEKEIVAEKITAIDNVKVTDNKIADRKLVDASATGAPGKTSDIATGANGSKVRAFIRPEERPAVENFALNPDGENVP